MNLSVEAQSLPLRIFFEGSFIQVGLKIYRGHNASKEHSSQSSKSYVLSSCDYHIIDGLRYADYLLENFGKAFVFVKELNMTPLLTKENKVHLKLKDSIDGTFALELFEPFELFIDEMHIDDVVTG